MLLDLNVILVRLATLAFLHLDAKNVILVMSQIIFAILKQANVNVHQIQLVETVETVLRVLMV